jgi:hypothetical protein
MANIYDRIFKENIEPLQLPLLAKLLNLRPPKLVPIDAKLQVTQEVEMDNIRRVVHDDDPTLDYGLQTEFHIQDEDLRRRNLVHYSLFHNITSLSLRQIVIYGGMATPTKITQNILELRGLRIEFEVIILKNIPKEEFINSNVPEEVILALLCDYGADKPEAVVRQILLNLKKILKKSASIKKYQRQLVVLSQLRKLETITIQEIETMDFHYDIETDGLYLQGLTKGEEKGIEKGIEQGVELGHTERDIAFTINLWSQQEFAISKIAALVNLSEEKVIAIITDHLRQQGLADDAIEAQISIFQRPL